MKISKAIITTAGFGTRFLPVTKTIQKEMLPILNRPLIDYVVQDLVKAGITDIYFVTNEHNQQVKQFYSESNWLYEKLKKVNKLDLYETLKPLHEQANFHFVVQPDSEQYGTAVPVKICEKYLKNEDGFLVFMGDDFMYHSEGKSEAASMIDLFKKAKVSGVATFMKRPKDTLHKYGIAQIEKKGDITFLKKLVEKPAPGTAPSDLANVSKYLLTPAIFDIIRTQKLNPQSNELYITDSVETLANQSGVAIYTPHGDYLDGGFPEGWLRANLRVAWDNPDMRNMIKEFVKEQS